jgi:N-acetylglucosaminyldiphosphoundecaprenol N-acetyl-beta-D-mannosaminyltransferase
MDETVESIAAMIHSRQPHYVATANVDFVVQVQEDIELRRILFDSHMVLCDGMPLVWASKRLGNPLRERVTGSDLIPRLLREAETRGWKVFFLGGTTESVAAAAANTLEKHPRLNLVGAHSPPFKPLLEMDHSDILRRVCSVKPDLLFVAFGCPKQEKWINMHYRHLGVPVSIGVGATLDFLAGTFKRAPVWMQKTGLEWLFRLLQEPKRLAKRYGRGLWIFGRAILRQAKELREQRRSIPKEARPSNASAIIPTARGPAILEAPARLDAAAAPDLITPWLETMSDRPVVLDLTRTEFIDSTGIGLLVRLRKRAREVDLPLLLASPTPAVTAALQLMKLESFFDLEPNMDTARERCGFTTATPTVTASADLEIIHWKGEITAGTIRHLAELAENRLENLPPDSEVTIDLTEVPFVDSSGVGLMLRLKKRAWQRRVAVLYANPTPAVINVLKLTRLEEFLMRRPK